MQHALKTAPSPPAWRHQALHPDAIGTIMPWRHCC